MENTVLLRIRNQRDEKIAQLASTLGISKERMNATLAIFIDMEKAKNIDDGKELIDAYDAIIKKAEVSFISCADRVAMVAFISDEKIVRQKALWKKKIDEAAEICELVMIATFYREAPTAEIKMYALSVYHEIASLKNKVPDKNYVFKVLNDEKDKTLAPDSLKLEVLQNCLSFYTNV